MTDARHTHDMEQALAGLVEFAAGLAQYVRELEEQGFSRDEAMSLAHSLQGAILTPKKVDP